MRELIYFFLAGFTYFYHHFSQTTLRVLAYHTVPNQEVFRKQIDFLNKNYNIISLPELEQFLYHKKLIPKNSLLITFDDGDVSVLKNGLPVLKNYHFPSVLFIITNLINSSETFWPRLVEKSFHKQDRSYADARIKVNYLKKISNTEREQYLQTLEPIESSQLTTEQVKHMEEEGFFIGNHTHTHPMINNCSDDEIRNELEQVAKRFEEWSLPGYPIFAYPNGNWDERTESILREKGIKLAFLFDHQLAGQQLNPLRISRIMVDADSEINEFKVKVSGLHSYLMKLKNKF